MPDWTYHTFLRPLLPHVPRRVLRAWGASRLGRRVIAWMADAPRDPRLLARASADTAGIVAQLGVGAARAEGPAVADAREAAREVTARGSVVLDIARGGPGLPKRVHEATAPPRAGTRRWGLVLLGLGMIAAGAGAWVVAATRVVLPYDEAYVSIPEEILPFLAHDRTTLAGTMMSIGILYASLAYFAPGAPWARRAIAASGWVGFGTFFLFLAYGYFDPLHAAISATLFPLFLWGVWTRPDGTAHQRTSSLADQRDWLRAQWGILGLVALGVGLIAGGITIAYVGSTSVFVASDLAFIGPIETSPRLVSLVAHDRAGFGGALASNGIMLALVAMWGVREGAGWLWWTLLAAGSVGFGATLGIHLAVGYVHAGHLAPVLVALALFVASLAALRPFMCSELERLQDHPGAEQRPRPAEDA